MRDGDFFKARFDGPGRYVSPTRDRVVAFFGTDAKDGTENEMVKVARQLANAGLFDAAAPATSKPRGDGHSPRARASP